MALERARTQHIVVMAAAGDDTTPWDTQCRHRENGLVEVGTHYVIYQNGDVENHRAHAQHGNLHPKYNADAVFVEVITQTGEMNEAQAAAADGLVEYLQETYLEAEPVFMLT